MGFIASHPYTKIERIVNSIEQKDIEHERTIRLYDDKITTQYREFPIEDVLDISQKKVGPVGGILYVHTKSGVFTYTIHKAADSFIQAFQQLPNKH